MATPSPNISSPKSKKVPPNGGKAIAKKFKNRTNNIRPTINNSTNENEFEQNPSNSDDNNKPSLAQRAYGKTVETTGKPIEKAGEVAESTGKAVEGVGKVAEGTGKVAEGDGKTVKGVGSAVRGAGGALSGAGKAVKKTGKVLKKGGEKAQKLGEVLQKHGQDARENPTQNDDPTSAERVSPDQELNLARALKDVIRRKAIETRGADEQSMVSDPNQKPSPGIAQSAPGVKLNENNFGDPGRANKNTPQEPLRNKPDPLAEQNFKPDSDVKPEAKDLAKDMAGPDKPAGGKKTPNQPGSKKEPFKAGGGNVPGSQFDPQKKSSKVGAAAQKTANAVKDSSEAVKRQLQAAKNTARQVKNTITAPARKLGEAKDAASRMIDDLNPIKKLKEIMEQVWRLIPIIVRIALASKGLGEFVSELDKQLKKSTVDKGICCCSGTTLAYAIGMCLLPIIILVLFVNMIASIFS